MAATVTKVWMDYVFWKTALGFSQCKQKQAKWQGGMLLENVGVETTGGWDGSQCCNVHFHWLCSGAVCRILIGSLTAELHDPKSYIFIFYGFATLQLISPFPDVRALPLRVRDFLRPFLYGLRGSRSISHRGEALPLHRGCCDGHYHDLLGVYQCWKLWFLRGTGMCSWGFKRSVWGIGGTGHLGGGGISRPPCWNRDESDWEWSTPGMGMKKVKAIKAIKHYAFSDRDGLIVQDFRIGCNACISRVKGVKLQGMTAVVQWYASEVDRRGLGLPWAWIKFAQTINLAMFSSVSSWRFVIMSILIRHLWGKVTFRYPISGCRELARQVEK